MIWALPALTAYLYAAGQLDLKKALAQGTARSRVTGVTNIALILWAIPLAFLFPGQWSSAGLGGAVLAGSFLFVGRIIMVRALDMGDLSLVAPILATKTILVALFTWLSGTGTITPQVLAAAALASIGMGLLGYGPSRQFKARWNAVSWALLASVFFALADVSTQAFAKLLGVGWFLPAMFGTVYLLFPFLGRQPPAPPEARKNLTRGSVIMGFQTALVVFLIAITGQATLVNIIYSTRSLWSVLVESIEGRGDARAMLGWRLSGATLLTAAVVLALQK
jgi:drug/metabolite transporter (DMT)-like permease